MKSVDVKERNDYILELIKTSGADGVRSSTIETDCNISKWTRQETMRKLMGDHPEIQRKGVHSGEGVYVWVEKPVFGRYPTANEDQRLKHSSFLKNRYEKTNKNDEGYTDMTATAAIKNTIKELTYSPNSGEIWKARESDGKIGYIFVLNFQDNAAQCIKLYDIDEVADPAAITFPYRVKIGSVTYIGDCSRVTYKPKKYLVGRARGYKSEELMTVRTYAAKALDIDSFRIKEVEVPGPEKIVEVEKVVYRDPEIPEGCISQKDADLAMARKEADLWRSAFWGLSKTLAPQTVSNS